MRTRSGRTRSGATSSTASSSRRACRSRSPSWPRASARSSASRSAPCPRSSAVASGGSVSGFINLSVAFPALLVAIFVAAVVGVGARGAVAGIGIARGAVLRAPEPDAVGVGRRLRLPGCRADARRAARSACCAGTSSRTSPSRSLITTTIAVGDALLALAGLSFLGLGVQPPQYDWGRMLNEGLEPDLRHADRRARPGDRDHARRAHASCSSARCSPRRLPGAESPAVEARRASRVPVPPAVPTAGDGGRPGPTDVLAVEDLTVSFPGGSVPVRDVSLEVAPRRDRRDRRRVGLWEDADRDGDRRPAPGRGPDDDRRATRSSVRTRATLGDSQRRRLLGRSLAVVYQDPMSALNPRLRVGRQLAEVSEVHDGLLEVVGDAARRRPPAAPSASPIPMHACASTRTSSRAACASAP